MLFNNFLEMTQAFHVIGYLTKCTAVIIKSYRILKRIQKITQETCMHARSRRTVNKTNNDKTGDNSSSVDLYKISYLESCFNEIHNSSSSVCMISLKQIS
uniref:Secreted protein n=1 Tax=Elaeophora elaphi TaxID=1147741 RepID=A0A0R3RNA3_9BILA